MGTERRPHLEVRGGNGAKEGRGKKAGAMRIGLLGRFSMTAGDRKVDESAWRLRKAASLLKLLALAPGHRLHRERAMDLLWPDLGLRAASNNLRQTLHVARRALHPDPEIASRYLSLSGEQLMMYPEGRLWVDVEAFEQAAASARSSRDPAAYRAAIELYSGELLPEDRYEEWAESRRQELRQTFLSLLVKLSNLYEERGAEEDLALAVQALQRVLAEEPTNEEAHVGLMRLYASSGRSGEALRQYGRLSEALSSGLGAEPSAAVRVLREEIAAGRFLAGPTQPASPLTGQTAGGGGGGGTHNLPAQRTGFVGRAQEMLEVKRALAMTHLLTLTGVGGLGKTRLALEVARDLVGAYPDGVWLVELAPLSEGKLVPQAVADALGVSERPGRSLADALVDDLRKKRVLLVLDNCEHLIDAAAQLADALLSSCPLLRVVATSREALGVEGELVWRMDPLSVPDAHRDAHRSPAAGELARSDAVRLFVERARRYSPQFELRAENAGAVAQICRGLEGMPLAIELVAARMDVLAPEQIAERVDHALGLLRSGHRAAEPRHQTLRATLNWSYELLGEPEQRLFGRLSVFAGGFSLEAAEAVGASNGIERSDVLEVFLILVDKSLVVAGPTGDGGARYRLLEPVRLYARERQEESGDAERVRRRHAAFFLALAKEAEPGLAGAQQQAKAERLEAEQDNMRAALSWSLKNEPEAALRLAGALARFWEMRCRFLEGSGWLEAALRQSGRADADTDAAARAKALSEAGTLAWHRGDYERAIVLHGEALELYRELGDDGGVAFAFLCLGAQYLEKSDLERAAPFFEEALELSQRIGDSRDIAYTLRNLAEVARQRGEYERAKMLGMECLSLYKEMADELNVARTVGWLGLLTFWSGDDHDVAERFLKEGLELNREIGNWGYGVYCLEGFAGLAGARGQGARAARLWGAAEALRRTISAPPTPEAQRYYERSMAAARAQLSEAEWEAALAEGNVMPAEEAGEYALSEEVAPAPERPLAGGATGGMHLTRREREVAAMVARGLSTRQIAQELVISERTVDKHVANLLKKLNLHSREQVAVRMAEHRAQLP